MERFSNFRNAKVVRLLKIEINEGGGTSEDPIRRVVYFCTLDGKPLWNDDTKRMFADEMKPL